MKKLLAMLLVVVMCVSVCACRENDENSDATESSTENSLNSNSDESKDALDKTTNTSDEQSIDVPNDDPSNSVPNVTAQDYYEYLNAVFLVEKTTVSTEPVTVDVNPMDFHYAWNLGDAGGNGLASAFIEDFNGDGVLEMLTVTVEHRSIQDSFFNRVVFDDGAPYDSSVRCTGLFIQHFNYKDGEISEQAYGFLSLMPETSWGKLIVGLEKVENEYYVFAKADGEDYMTYGPSMFTATHIGGNSLKPLYISPLRYGRAINANYLELTGISGELDITQSTLEDVLGKLPQHVSQKTPDEIRNSLGERILCVVDFNNLWDEDILIATVTDYTKLQENLADNGANWQKIILPEGSKK